MEKTPSPTVAVVPSDVGSEKPIDLEKEEKRRTNLETCTKNMQILFKDLKEKKEITLLEAFIDAGIPAPMSVLQRCYANTKNNEELKKFGIHFEDAAVITSFTLDIGTISPKNYINDGVKNVKEGGYPSKKLIQLFNYSLRNKRIQHITNTTFQSYVIYIEELDWDEDEITVDDVRVIDHFTIASRIKEMELNASGIPTTNRVVLRFMSGVDGWFLHDLVGSRYRDSFILPPYLCLRIDNVFYSNEHNLYIVDVVPLNGKEYVEGLKPKDYVDGLKAEVHAKQLCANKAFMKSCNSITGEEIYINAVTNKQEPLLKMPADWAEYFDSESGNYFYYNRKTKEKQWEHPALKSVAPNTGSWRWKPDIDGCKYSKDGRRVTVIKNMFTSPSSIKKAFQYVIPCEMKITTNAITQWKINIEDFGGLSPMMLIGVVQVRNKDKKDDKEDKDSKDIKINEEMDELIADKDEDSSLPYKGWFMCCTGCTLFGSSPHKCSNRLYSESKNLKKGDSIICELNLVNESLSFYINGVSYGNAFVKIPTDEFLVPCICLTNINDSVHLIPPGPQN